MSTVLRPVGPHEARVYWIRRASLILAIVIVILVIAKACAGGGGGTPRPAAGHHTTSTTPSSTPKPVVPACDPATLKLKLSTDTSIYTVQQAPTLMATFTNQGPTCKLARSASQEIWTVKSGTPTVWSTQGCPPASPVPASLKVAQGATKVVSIVWDARLRTSSCTETQFAAAGTYTLHATLDGVTAPNVAVFHITK